jgi:hypothetical protein
MAHEVNLGGTIYVSSTRAAEKFGYSRDYIGQLLRTGRIIGKKIGGLWYVLEESLHGHKTDADAYVPNPPKRSESTYSAPTPSSLLSLDGNPYISAAEGARITGYSQDYIGQLARRGIILSRLVGRKWYVDAKALKSHKAEKDALLSEVQVASVGLQRTTPAADNENKTVELHYTYVSDTRELLPSLKSPLIANTQPGEEMQKIPIRKIQTANRTSPVARGNDANYGPRKMVRAPGLSIFYGSFTAVLGIIAVVVAYNINLVQLVPTYGAAQSSVVRTTALANAAENGVKIATNTIRGIFQNEITYQRTENWKN